MIADERAKATGKTIMGAVASLHGFIANDNDDVGRLFDWYGNGNVIWGFTGTDDEAPTTVVRGDRVTHLVYDVSR